MLVFRKWVHCSNHRLQRPVRSNRFCGASSCISAHDSDPPLLAICKLYAYLGNQVDLNQYLRVSVSIVPFRSVSVIRFSGEAARG